MKLDTYPGKELKATWKNQEHLLGITHSHTGQERIILVDSKHSRR